MHTRADDPTVRAKRQAHTEADPWPTPRPLASALAEVCLLDPDLLPETLRPWILDLAERLQVPVDYPAAALTVMLAGTIGRRALIRPLRLDQWVVSPNLWGTIIGAPLVEVLPRSAAPIQRSNPVVGLRVQRHAHQRFRGGSSLGPQRCGQVSAGPSPG